MPEPDLLFLVFMRGYQGRKYDRYKYNHQEYPRCQSDPITKERLNQRLSPNSYDQIRFLR